MCFLIILGLVSCARSSADRWKCSSDEQVCVYVHTNEPVLYGEPVVVTVTVTSERDIPELGVTLAYDVGDVIEGIETWEGNLQYAEIWEGAAGWGVSINAHQTLTFTRTLHLPPRQGDFAVIASISDKYSFHVSNMVGIVMTTQGGTVYLANTRVPRTPGPLPTMNPFQLQTLRALPTATSLRTLTPIPTKTSTPTTVAYPAPPTPRGEGPIEEPYP